MRRVLVLLSGLLKDHPDVVTILKSGEVTNAQMIELVLQAPEIVSDDRVTKLMTVFFIPDGEKYDQSKEDERSLVMEDAPLGLLYGAVSGFFRGKTIAVENTSTGSTPPTP